MGTIDFTYRQNHGTKEWSLVDGKVAAPAEAFGSRFPAYAID